MRYLSRALVFRCGNRGQHAGDVRMWRRVCTARLRRRPVVLLSARLVCERDDLFGLQCRVLFKRGERRLLLPVRKRNLRGGAKRNCLRSMPLGQLDDVARVFVLRRVRGQLLLQRFARQLHEVSNVQQLERRHRRGAARVVRVRFGLPEFWRRRFAVVLVPARIAG